MSKKRGCLMVFGGIFVVLFIVFAISAVRTKRANERADDAARELCARIPIGSTLASARATARRHAVQPREIESEGTHHFVFLGGTFHQGECAVEVRDGVVAKASFRVDDY